MCGFDVLDDPAILVIIDTYRALVELPLSVHPSQWRYGSIRDSQARCGLSTVYYEVQKARTRSRRSIKNQSGSQESRGGTTLI